jgi:DNA-binding beta-propeller fold protein YncE
MKKFSTLLTSLAITSTTLISAQNVHLERIGGYETGAFDEGAAEIISYNASNSYLYSVNSNDVTVDIISLVDPTNPSKVKSVDISTYGASANCVAVGSGYFVVAVEHPDSAQGVGSLEFFSLEGTHITSVVAGALPDNVGISPDGNYVVAANEGEPNDDYTYDPEGSITVVDLSGGVQSLSQSSVTQVSLTQFNGMNFTDGTIVTTNPGTSTVAQDLEPEYVAFNSTSTEAYVVCQENNTIVTVNLSNNNISIDGLGFKEWANTNAGLDASNKAATVDFRK